MKYLDTILADEPLFCFSFSEASGLLLRDTAGRKGGTLPSSGITYGGSAPFIGGQSLAIAPGQMINLGRNAASVWDGASAVTLEAIFNPATIADAAQIIYFGLGNGLSALALDVQAGARLHCGGRSGNGDSFQGGSTSTGYLAVGSWCHVVFELDFLADRVRMWDKNGSLFDVSVAFGNSTYVHTSASGNDSLAGYAPNPAGTYFPASFAALAVYTGKLTSTRRQAHFDAAYKTYTVAGTVAAGDPPAHVKRKLFFVSRSGEFLGSTDSDATTGAYSLPTTEGGAVYALAFVDRGDVWVPTTAYALGAKALTRTNNDHWYEVETAGTTGASEPTWPTSGGTVTDGTVVWRDKGLIAPTEADRPWAEGPYAAPAA